MAGPVVRLGIVGCGAATEQKARRVLGYDPKVGLAERINRTAAWIKWARL